MRIVLTLSLLCLSMGFGESGCTTRRKNMYCQDMKFNYDEPFTTNQSVHIVELKSSNGSISTKTLQPIQEVESLEFFDDDINLIEDGALCSLPNLKGLCILECDFPRLTKNILSGCHKLEIIMLDIPMEEDALHEITSLKQLSLFGATKYDFSKAYIEPLKQLEELWLIIDHFKTEEPGLFCSSPNLETLHLDFESSVELPESLFDGCNNLKRLHIKGGPAMIQGCPFKHMPSLEKIGIEDVEGIHHITKECLSGIPNLKSVHLEGYQIRIDENSFENIPHLKYLALERAGLEDSDLKALRPLLELDSLSLRHNNIETLDSLPALPNLVHLNVDYNKISDYSLDNLRAKLPKVLPF